MPEGRRDVGDAWVTRAVSGLVTGGSVLLAPMCASETHGNVSSRCPGLKLRASASSVWTERPLGAPSVLLDARKEEKWFLKVDLNSFPSLSFSYRIRSVEQKSGFCGLTSQTSAAFAVRLSSPSFWPFSPPRSWRPPGLLRGCSVDSDEGEGGVRLLRAGSYETQEHVDLNTVQIAAPPTPQSPTPRRRRPAGTADVTFLVSH